MPINPTEFTVTSVPISQSPGLEAADIPLLRYFQLLQSAHLGHPVHVYQPETRLARGPE